MRRLANIFKMEKKKFKFLDYLFLICGVLAGANFIESLIIKHKYYCPLCDEPVKNYAKECLNCGSKLKWSKNNFIKQ